MVLVLEIGAISAVLQVLLERMSPRMNIWEFWQRHEFNEILFKKLETTMLQVNAVLSDAEEKQITNPFVRKWIDELKDAAYHTTDLLDEIHSLALAEFHTSNSSDESDLKSVIKNSKSKLEEMTIKLENLAKYKDVLGLKDSFSGKPSPRLQLTSLVDETEVYGRETDKGEIMEFLISTGKNDQIPAVVAIVGIAGVGKTTLAQLLYNDPKVQNHFDKRAWVYISEDFDVFKVTKTLYESITLKPCDIKDLNILQLQLKVILTGKKFLIVLDDVWNEYYNKWDALRNFLKVGASGSRIVVTTRSQGVASTMRAIHTHHLQPLEGNACWSVFANQAFGSPCACDASPKLKSIGKEIMKKCGGLPLAAKVLGSLLYSKIDAHEWNNILKSNIWDLSNGKSDILPSLRLSYYNLSSHLKQCFAYCSIFPKGYVYDKEKLILLWMAEGFLPHPRSGQTMEEVGIECFHELLSNSFFQQRNDGNKQCFVMHDPINDLAQFVSGESCFKFEKGKSYCISKTARHFSYVRDQIADGLEKFDALNEAEFLRTFLPLSLSSPTGSCKIDMTVVDEYLPRQKRLRVLSLSHYGIITSLPSNFGKLLHLRYLDLSENAIAELPKSIGCLYNLQTLILSNCAQLVRLPANMRNLINLGYLDLNGTSSLKKMPPEFCRLKSLQILTTFVVSNSNRGSSISELGGLSLLHGKLSILKLQKVRNVEDAENAKLKDKEKLKELEFNWSNNGGLEQETVIEKLRPHENIEKVSIAGYGGTRLPDWLGDSSFSNMVILYLINCQNCLSLPSLGQLSSLRELRVKNMQGLDSIQVGFYGNGSSSFVSFASLRILEFEDMPNWKRWSPLAVIGGGFPSLLELHIQNCENLIEIPNFLPSLESLFIIKCRKLQIDVSKDYPALQTLHLRSCSYPVNIKLNFFSKFKSLQIQDCIFLRFLEISDELHQELGFFQELEISECDSMLLFSGRRILPAPKLTTFSVSKCKNLRSMPEQMHMLLSSLQTLTISACPELVSFPEGGLPPSLQKLTIQNCDKLQSMPEQMHILVALQTLTISGCPELVSFPEGGLPPSLQTLTIQNCDKLQSMPEQMHILLALQTLNISGCPELVSFPEDGLPLRLETLFIKNCFDLTPPNAWGLRNMTLLAFLTIECAYADVISFPDQDLLPTSLTYLQISEFPNLKTLNLRELQHLTLLKSLQIHSCNQLQILSDDGSLPSSLSSLTINGFPSLTKLCQRDQGDYWDKISHIPNKVINGKVIH